MRKSNSIEVYTSIKKGNHSILNIKNDTNLSHVTVEKICENLKKRGFLTCRKDKQDYPGRRSKRYYISEKHYSVYIEETPFCFSAIFINTQSCAIERFEYIKRKKTT